MRRCPMLDEKKWYASKGIWGGVITLLSVILTVLGYQLTPEDQELIVASITAVMGGIGGLLAIWGRVRASKPIKN